MKETYPNKEFFDNVGFIEIIDLLSQRYGIVPTELLDMSVYDFTLNIAIMLKAMNIENDRRGGKKRDQKTKKWSNFGFDYKEK